MKLFISLILCMINSTVALGTIIANRLVDEKIQKKSLLFDEIPTDMDSLIKRVGIKALIENALEGIKYLKIDHTNFEKALQTMQQELHTMQNSMSTMGIPNNQCIETLQYEVKILKWALAINFSLVALIQAYFYYDQF